MNDEPTSYDRAAELQLDACLHELAGAGPDAALPARILAALAAARPAAREARHAQWLLAAALVLGSGVVAAIAWMQHDEHGQRAVVTAPQDPQPAPTPAPKPAPKPAPAPEAKQDPEAKPAEAKKKEPYTLIADYSDNRVVEVDAKGRIVWELDEVFGAWDAERLDNDNFLITEFSVSRVREVDRKGRTVWEYEDLKNPYDADRLPNGNTLIADTFGSRVIEVNPKKEIVWSFDKDIRPFDVDRLPDGNTLIADVLKDRVIEVNPAGEIVWELLGMPNAHDADRLPNGNTLVTLRNQGRVVEVDKNGKVVWELKDLSSPSDADRLPDGNTLVAENTRVREFDKNGKVVWETKMTWAVEANRYVRVGRDDQARFRDGTDSFFDTLNVDTYASKTGKTTGLIVKGIDPKASSSFGVAPGDVLIEINGHKVESKAQARSLMEGDYKRGVRSFQTKWLSGGQTIDRTIQVPDN